VTEAMDDSSRMIVVSGDSHVRPRLEEDLRPYYRQNYLEEFDRFIEANVNTMDSRRHADILTVVLFPVVAWGHPAPVFVQQETGDPGRGGKTALGAFRGSRT
jgi:hypothetical protein